MSDSNNAPPDAYRKVERLQSYVGCPGKPISVNELQDTVQKRQKKKGAAAWWAYMHVVVVAGVDKKAKERYDEVKLQCSYCKALLSASNPSKSCGHHLRKLSSGLYECINLAKAREHVATYVDAPADSGQATGLQVSTFSRRY
jgi:hypothetical protein